jgi:hypothetical protein
MEMAALLDEKFDVITALTYEKYVRVCVREPLDIGWEPRDYGCVREPLGYW